MATHVINDRLKILAKSAYRAKFKLGKKECEMVREKGSDVIRQHAHDLISKRLAPAKPHKDGKQTPYRGHPVFIAQHATATCCRSCLQRWHQIEKGRELDQSEQAYVVSVIDTWISNTVK